MKTCFKIEDGKITDAILIDDDANPADWGGVDAATLPDGVGVNWRYVVVGATGDWTPPVTVDPVIVDPVSRRSMRLAEISAAADALLAAGAPYTGLHIALDDGARADLTAMAATATAAAGGAVSWPESYSRGWISIENTRIPLATPAAGLTLAAAVGDRYARLVQHRRDLKDAVLAAEDVDALDAIDITAGWPA